MAEHSPGPWMVETQSEVPKGRIRVVRVFAARGLAQRSELNCRFGPDATDMANARLIAQAPELLAACEKALEDCTTCGGTDRFLVGLGMLAHWETGCPHCAYLRAAIAKAKGGGP